VGRKRRHQFQHRRQILRCCTESDTHANTFSDPICDANSYADGNRYSDGNGNSNAERNS
jgi:hypothetical protein